MGILHKMLLVLQRVDPDLSIWLKNHLGSIEPGVFRDKLLERIKNENWEYVRKLLIIQNSIYGIDIQTIAVEISKLRFFLSLIVDEKIEDAKENRGVEALPNLEFKFVAANSLIGLPPAINRQIGFGGGDELDRLKELRNNYLRSYGKDKIKIEEDFRQTRGKLIEHSIKWGGKDALALQLANWNPFSNETCDWFDPDWMFGVSDGFDVVIANPPYIQLQKEGGKLANMFQDCGYKTFERTGDIYALFYENGVNTLRKDGHLCFITSNKWMRAGYGESLRAYFLTKNPLLLIDLGPGVFEKATVDTNILIVQNAGNNDSLRGLSLSAEAKGKDLMEFVSQTAVSLPKMGKGAWFIGSIIEQNLNTKIESIGKPLREWDVKIYRGILTGFNEAFIIDSTTRTRIIEEDPQSVEIIKPILRGRDIGKYVYKWSGSYLLATEFDINVPKLYPAVYKHLRKFEEKAKKRDDQGMNWWNLRACSYYHQFEKEKIAWIDLADEGRFSKVDSGVYIDKTLFFLTGPNIQYLLGVLNSKLINWYFDTICSSSGVGTNLWSKISIESLPVPKITGNNLDKTNKLCSLVSQVENINKSTSTADTKLLEKQIDQMVYELYGLTPEEIRVVEGAIK